MIEVKSKDGLITKCQLSNFDYSGQFMGERTLTATYDSPAIVDFEIDDYVEYRGEKFVIDYDPSISRLAKTLQSGKAISYQLLFKPFSVELEDCGFQDYVLYDNQLHYSPSPKFSFVGTATDMVDRIQANMDRLYPGLWKIEISPSVHTDDKSIEVDNISCWNALVRLNKEYGLNFSVLGRTVRIGFQADTLNHTFYYGKGNGLYKIDKSVNSDEAIITRLYAYGSNRNIPEDYNKRATDIVPKKNLMLPGYKDTGINYIESSNISKYGIREYSVLFDDIYPSIEGVEIPEIGRIDEIVSAEKVTEDTKDKVTFTIEIKDIGFDINDYLTKEKANISIKSGSLIGYEFEIAKVEKTPTGGYKLTLNKSDRDKWIVPNKDQNLSPGDRFVLLNIKMPEKYVSYAEEKLLVKAKEYLSHYDHATYTYNIGVDEIFMARNFNLYQSIREGDKLRLYDADLAIDYEIIIQSLSIKEGGSVPTYTISLSDQPVAGTIDKIWDAIENIKDTGTIAGQGTGTSGGISTEELNRKYLRKDVDDTDFGNLYLNKNIQSSIYLDGMDGKGWQISDVGRATFDSGIYRADLFIGKHIGSETFISGFTNGIGWDLGPYKRFNAAEVEETKWRLETDDIVVRGSFRAFEMIISQLRGENDNVTYAGQMKVAFYDPSTNRLYLDTERGILYNPFRPGDILAVQRYGGMPSAGNNYNLIKNYELQVTDAQIGSISDGEDRLDWISFKNFIGSLTDIATGDILTRQDSVSDSTRKGIVNITTINEVGAPYLDVVYGIKTDPLHATKVRLGNLSGIRTKTNVDLSGVWGLYASGAVLENSTIYLENGETVEQSFTIMNGDLNSKIEGVRNDMSLEKGNILRNSSFSTDTFFWESNNDIHFINVNGAFLWLDGNFYAEKDKVADIYRDGAKNVLRIKHTSIKQKNEYFNLESKEDLVGTYSFSIHYKVVEPGALTIGFAGKELFLQQQLAVSDKYEKLSKVGIWDGTGDFEMGFTGDILIYGVSLFNDALSDEVVKLQTQIAQNKEKIELSATKDYVNEKTNQIYIHYDSKLTVTAEQISGISTKVDNINNTIDTAGWITKAEGNTLFASKTMEDGNKIISYINQTATDTTISSSKINLYGAVTFQMFDPSLTNKINNKADTSDIIDALQNYVTNSDLDSKLSDYALASSLENLVSSSYLTNALKSYATKAYAESEAQSQGQTVFNTLTDAMINGKTTVIGGLISSKILDVDSIYANQAYIGNFSIENGWFKSNATAGQDVGYIDMRTGSTRIAFGADLKPGSVGGAVTSTAEITNGKIASSPGGSAYALALKASGDVSTDKHAIAIDCNGGARIRGEFSLIEDLFVRSADLNISNSSCSSAANLRSRRTFVYQVSTVSNIYLPSDTAIANEFGYFSSGGAVADHSVITVRILVSRWSAAGINVQCSIPIVDNNGNPLKENNAVSYYNFNMDKGDYAELMYYNRNWYLINNNK